MDALRDPDRNFPLTEVEQKVVHLRWIDRCCLTCRYYRNQRTGCCSVECLLLGRSLAIGDYCFTVEACRGRVCDRWEKRPVKWQVDTEGTDRNPHLVDPYISREKCKGIRRGLVRQLEAIKKSEPKPKASRTRRDDYGGEA